MELCHCRSKQFSILLPSFFYLNVVGVHLYVIFCDFSTLVIRVSFLMTYRISTTLPIVLSIFYPLQKRETSSSFMLFVGWLQVLRIFLCSFSRGYNKIFTAVLVSSKNFSLFRFDIHNDFGDLFREQVIMKRLEVLNHVLKAAIFILTGFNLSRM